MPVQEDTLTYKRRSMSSSLNFHSSFHLQKYLSGKQRLSLAKTRTVQDEADDILNAPGRVLIPPAIRSQLQNIQQTGSATLGGNTFTPSLAILASINKMLYYSLHHNSAANPAFAILSYLRPGSRHHSNGTAVDLAIVDGRAIVVSNQQACLQAIVAAINNLAPGNYALGLPRPPRTDASGAATDAARYRYLRLYDTSTTPPQLLPQYANLPQTHYFLGAQFNERYVPGGITGGLAQINNATARAQLTTAIANARAQGANVLHLMADALDHLHIQQI
ncbi:MAG: hypothetical protein ACOYXT_18495 [Bacteroidota bacterium]